MVTCTFCRQEGKRAKEHVWPRWLIERYGNERTAYSHRTFTAEISRRVHTPENYVLGDVCEACNNGWLSDLEAATKRSFERLFFPLAGPTELTIPAAECATLSLWAFKTAIVMNRASNYRRIVPRFHYPHLHDRRSVPSEVRVHIGFATARGGLGSRMSQHGFGVVNSDDTKRSLAAMQRGYYHIALGVPPVAFSVMRLPLAMEAEAQPGMVLIAPSRSQGAQMSMHDFADLDDAELSVTMIARSILAEDGP